MHHIHQEKKLECKRDVWEPTAWKKTLRWLLWCRTLLLASLNATICGRGWLIQDEQHDPDSWTSWQPHHLSMHISQALMVKAQIQTCSVLLNSRRDAGFLCLMRSREKESNDKMMRLRWHHSLFFSKQCRWIHWMLQRQNNIVMSHC